MNEKQAEEKGYNFTGIYEFDEVPVKDKLEKIRQSGYKAVMVMVPGSSLSRGGPRRGYSVYAENKYFTDKEKIDLRKRLAHISPRKLTAWENYQKESDEISEDERKMGVRLAQLPNPNRRHRNLIRPNIMNLLVLAGVGLLVYKLVKNKG